MDDHSEEYERLRGGLDREGVLAFAQHRNTLAGHPSRRLSHLAAVGELAGRYAEVYYQDDDDYMKRRYRRQVCEAAGFLHETMLQGCDYEVLLDVADEAVASVVAAVTPDLRLPYPKRVRMLGNQVGLAVADAQLVKLADLRHECVAKLATAELGARTAELAAWLVEAGEVLSCLNKLRNTPIESRVAAVKREVVAMDRMTREVRRKP